MKNILLLVFGIFFLSQIVLGEEHRLCPLGDDFHRSYIGLLLSPIIGNRISRQIRIVWGNERFTKGDMILLFFHHSVKGFKKIYELGPTEAFGMKNTGFYIDPKKLFPDIPEQNFTAKCTKYYVAWFREGFIRDINCLGIQPTWMEDQRHFLEDNTLQELFIPGTHDSGSYRVQGYNRLGLSLSPYAKTQDLNVLQQLLFGARYLDIRVGYYPDNKDEVWWVNHNTVRMVPLDTIIVQVNIFLSNTNEFVIFNVRELPVGFGNYPVEYERLFCYLSKKFERHAIPSEYNWERPLSAVWMGTSKRLYLTFDFTGKPFKPSTVRNPITQYWGDADDATVLYENLNAAERVPIEEDDFTPKASIPEFISKNNGSPQDSLVSLRERANSINHNITIWYHKYWFDLANIVAVDFLPSSGVVDVAIRANKFRFRRRKEIGTNVTCSKPYLRSASIVEPMMNQINVTNLLFPRIVADAPEKIYDLIAFT